MYKLTRNIIPINIHIYIDKEKNFELVFICFIRSKSLLIILDPFFYISIFYICVN